MFAKSIMKFYWIFLLGYFFTTKKMPTHQGITVQCYMKRSNISFNFHLSFWEKNGSIFHACFPTEKIYSWGCWEIP